MDIGIVIAIAMLAFWAVVALMFDGPGWIHILLTAGVFLLLQRIVIRGSRRPPPR